MIQATAAVVAVALAIIAMPSSARARSYPCWIVRWYVNNHTKEEIEAAARKHRVTAKERAAHYACLKDNK